MPKKREKQKATESIQLLDVYENWLAKQPVRPVKGKPGFISAAEAEARAAKFSIVRLATPRQSETQ